MTLTQDEIDRYAPYHTMPDFERGFAEYSAGTAWGDYRSGVAAQAYDRGAECAMRRMRNT